MRYAKSERLSSESCSEYENPSEATPCRFESGPGHQNGERRDRCDRLARLRNLCRESQAECLHHLENGSEAGIAVSR